MKQTKEPEEIMHLPNSWEKRGIEKGNQWKRATLLRKC